MAKLYGAPIGLSRRICVNGFYRFGMAERPLAGGAIHVAPSGEGITQRSKRLQVDIPFLQPLTLGRGAHQESVSTATNEHARIDHQPSQQSSSPRNEPSSSPHGLRVDDSCIPSIHNYTMPWSRML